MGRKQPGTFSLRYGLRPRPQGLLYDSVPQGTRVGLVHIVDEYNLVMRGSALYKQATHLLRWEREAYALEDPAYALGAFKEMLIECEWWAFFDLCEVIADCLRGRSGGLREFQTSANRLFDEEYVGWRLKNGLVERVGTEQSQRLIDEARRSLGDARFTGPEEQFEKALRSLSARPEADTANCVKDAVGALEGVARIVTGDHAAVLSDIVKELKGRRVIHGALAKCFDGLYGYRGDADGVGHGAVTGAPVPIAEAELALNMSASLIIYLANKAAEGAL